jgi:hypothetical protein
MAAEVALEASQGRVVTFLQNERPQPPAVRHAQVVRLALPPPVEQATANDEGISTRHKAFDISLREEPRDRLVVRAQREVRQDPWATPCPGAEEVVAKHPKGVNHCKQFENVRQLQASRSARPL